MQRVVITGIGIVSCLGTDVKTVETSLRLGRSGIVYDKKRGGNGISQSADRRHNRI